MEKTAVVREGVTPSEVSGKPSTMVKNGKAFAVGEKDTLSDGEKRLAASMDKVYTGGR